MEHTFKKKRAALLAMADDMPVANGNLLKLIIKETDGNINAFAKKIGVSQQLVDFAIKPDKDGFFRNFPSVQNAVIKTYGFPNDWFTYEHEDVNEAFQEALPTTAKEKAEKQKSEKSNEDFMTIIANLTSQLQKQTEINERYSLMIEKLVSKIMNDEDIK